MLLVITEVLWLDVNIMEFRKWSLAIVQRIRSDRSSDEDPFPKPSGQHQVPILCKLRTFLCPGLREPDGCSNHQCDSEEHGQSYFHNLPFFPLLRILISFCIIRSRFFL